MVSESEGTLRVLMIDDNPVDARLVERHLGNLDRWSMDFTHAREGSAGVQSLQEENIDVVLMDYDLNRSDGVELVEQLRSRGIRIPIVMLTGHGNERVARELIHAGGDDYLTKKDLTPETLLDALEFVLGDARDSDTWQERIDEWAPLNGGNGKPELLGRREFVQFLNQRLIHAAEEDDNVCLAIMDLRYQDENDRPASGPDDEIFDRAEDVLREQLNDRDVAGRHGDSEYAIVFVREALKPVTETCRSIRDKVVDLEPGSEPDTPEIQCSIGLAQFRGDEHGTVNEDNVYDFIDRADQALNRARKREQQPVERRSFHREPIGPIPVELRWNQQTTEGWVIDHSREGVRVRCKDELTPYQPITLRFAPEDMPLDTSESESTFEGVVRWNRSPESDDHYHIGVTVRIPRGLLGGSPEENRPRSTSIP